MQWPRCLATEILKKPNKKAMDAALEDVPDHLHGMVRFYLNDWTRKAGGLSALVKQQNQHEGLGEQCRK